MSANFNLSALQDVYDGLELAAKTYGLKRLASDVDKSYSALANELSRQQGYKLGLSTVALILDRTLDMRPLEQLCEIFEHRAVQIPKLARPITPFCGAVDLLKSLSTMSLEFAHTSEVFARALADGKMTDGERILCRKEVDELMEACMWVKLWLEGR